MSGITRPVSLHHDLPLPTQQQAQPIQGGPPQVISTASTLPSSSTSIAQPSSLNATTAPTGGDSEINLEKHPSGIVPILQYILVFSSTFLP